MDDLTFTEQDAKKTVDFLNIVLGKARFDFSSQEALAFSELLKHMSEVTKKINSHILEVKKISKPEKKESK